MAHGLTGKPSAHCYGCSAGRDWKSRMPCVSLRATQTTLPKGTCQITKYLLGNKDLSLTFEREPESDFDLSVYTDSNFAEKADDRRSVSGVLVYWAIRESCAINTPGGLCC